MSVDVPEKSDVPDTAPVMSEAWKAETSSFRKVNLTDGVALPSVPLGKNTAPREEKKADDGAAKDKAEVEKAETKPDGEGAEHGEDKADEKALDAKKGEKSKLPKWLAERVERVNAKESAADEKVRVAEEKRVAAEEALAVERAKNAKPATVAKKPDPDDYDTVKEYDDALISWSAAQKKPEPEKKVEAKTDDKAPSLPPGVDPADIKAAVASVKKAIDKPTMKALEDLPVLPPMVILEMGDSDDPQAMAAFVIGNPEIIEEIAKLKPRQQAPALIKAFAEAEKPKRKIKSDAPAPLDRLKGTGAPSPGLDGGFKAYEARRNAEENAQRRH